jgi:hypothetical protein
MEPISERAREALSDHRARTGFGPGRKDAVLERLEASIAAGAASDFVAELDQATPEAGKGASPGTAAGRRARIGGMLALALAAGLAGVWWVSGDALREQASPMSASAVYEGESAPVPGQATPREAVGTGVVTPETAVEAPVEPAPALASEREDPPKAKRPRTRRPEAEEKPSTPPPENDLAAELALLREARAALAREDRAGALTRLDRHAKQFPHGQLEPERSALRVEVLCELDPARGERARSEFLARFGGSGHAKRVRALTCRSTD